MKIKEYIPLLENLSDYSKTTFREDATAGLTVSILLIPQGMAYAFLAGMPPIYGLYGGLIPLFLYGLLGSSRQLSIGPVAISALLVLAGISELAEPGSDHYIQLVITTGLLIGIVQIILGLLRMGFLVNFLSHPVVAGFTSAAAVIIALSQLKDLLGFPIPRFQYSYETVLYAVEYIDQSNWITILLCFSSIAFILALRRINKKLPGALIVVLLGTIISWLLNLENRGVSIIRDIPKGLPGFMVPELSFETIISLMPTVFTVTIIGIVESIGIAKVLESRHQDHEVRPNQELLALGFSKLGGAFFQSLPTSGSFTRSAINSAAGAKSGMASIVAAVFVMLTLIFLTPLFYFLPKAILAAIILLAVRSLFDYREAIYLWQTHRRDFVMMLVTFVFTLALGIEEGVLVGVILSVLAVLYRSSRPHVAILGKLPGTTYYRNIDRFEEAEQLEDVIIMRFDNQLYFGNAAYFKDVIRALVKDNEPKIKYFFLDAKSMYDIDSSGLRALHEVYRYLSQRGVQLYISGAIGPVRDMLHKSGLLDEIGKDHHFMYLNDAIEDYKVRKSTETGL